ncbi:hypothetical protein G7B40_039685 [Aetokthonos hydrillicola Thurmond2011]|uniref:Uncharacterized protein n=1 Tax=Aetokthonos hydrillicola Thurmond2011 TaxID=2712845 RepID=A0AAP5IG01_9CYAN|nr:hypothetical protein [Aetokthonos hydrillicola CCALA 1050]MDR9900614.1 hypothetical protein [Aetokthonos hydrillicola Thurmond2011]
MPCQHNIYRKRILRYRRHWQRTFHYNGKQSPHPLRGQTAVSLPVWGGQNTLH